MLQEIKKNRDQALKLPICVYNKFFNPDVQLLNLIRWSKLCLKQLRFMSMVHVKAILA